MAEVLSKQPPPAGPRLTIITNAGGPGVLATDTLLLGGGKLAELSPESMQELNQFLPNAWSHSNPIDILGDASPELYAKTLQVAVKDPNSDGILIILTPQDMTDPTQTAEQLRAYVNGKPILASWMGGVNVHAGERILNRANIATFPYPDLAVRVFNYMWRYSDNLTALYETPMICEQQEAARAPDRALVQSIIDDARAAGRTLLTEQESKAILGAYHIPVPSIALATSPDEAAAAADELGYPVVLKLHSHTITHKMDVGGVVLHLHSADQVRKAYAKMEQAVSKINGGEHFLGATVQPMVNLRNGYEIIIGSSIDPQFGPVLLFGMGGSLVEVFRDRALALPPLTNVLARSMMKKTKIFKAMLGVRGRGSVDMHAMENILVSFSQLVVEQPWIKEIDINPLFVSEDTLMALDARVLLHPLDATDLPKLAIRPYPIEYVGEWKSDENGTFLFRPIRPDDEPAMVKFHETLSERTVQLRFFTPKELVKRISHDRLTDIVFIDYDCGMVLAAIHHNSRRGEDEIAAVGRLTKEHSKTDAEFGMIVSDRFQGVGLGREMLRRLIEVGRAENIRHISGVVHPGNVRMLSLADSFGFTQCERSHGGIEIQSEGSHGGIEIRLTL
jgi:acetyltransferase